MIHKLSYQENTMRSHHRERGAGMQKVRKKHHAICEHSHSVASPHYLMLLHLLITNLLELLDLVGGKVGDIQSQQVVGVVVCHLQLECSRQVHLETCIIASLVELQTINRF